MPINVSVIAGGAVGVVVDELSLLSQATDSAMQATTAINDCRIRHLSLVNLQGAVRMVSDHCSVAMPRICGDVMFPAQVPVMLTPSASEFHEITAS